MLFPLIAHLLDLVSLQTRVLLSNETEQKTIKRSMQQTHHSDVCLAMGREPTFLKD